MATSGVIARKTPQGFEGRYLYSDAHPKSVGPTLFELYHFFGNDSTRLTRYLIDEHSAWRDLVQKDYSLSPGYNSFSFPDRCPQWDREVRRDEATSRQEYDQYMKDFEAWKESYYHALELYSQSEDGRRPQCYCHGDSQFQGDYYFSLVDALASSCQYVYVIDELTATIQIYYCPILEKRWSLLLFPAQFLLVATTMPCPCGFFNDPVHECTCSAEMILEHQQRIKPFIDSCFDIHVEVPRVWEDLLSRYAEESSTQIRGRVEQARKRQHRRYGGTANGRINADLSSVEEIQRYCLFDPTAETLLRLALRQLHPSPQGILRMQKVAWTIADLAGSEQIMGPHLAEAIQYRPRI